MNLTSTPGRYGPFGGCYLPESLMAPIEALKTQFDACQQDPVFQQELQTRLQQYCGRPTPLTPAPQLSKRCQGATVLLKREDLLHTGAHKMNNALGQCLLAKHMQKTRVIAETGAGQHGVATATACAHLQLQCDIVMGQADMQRQAANVAKMRLLGANVIAVTTGSQTLKDAVNAALRDYAHTFENTHYCLGSALGPHPYPTMVTEFQRVIGDEARQQCLDLTGRLPTELIACVGGGSNAIGLFTAFLDDEGVTLTGVEAGGKGLKLSEHAARLRQAQPGVLHGSYSLVLQHPDGQIAPTHSISAGLDYPMIGPMHAHLAHIQRAHYTSVTDRQALHAFETLSQLEGIIPALESAHAVAHCLERASEYSPEDIIIINLSGRGDKDLDTVQQHQACHYVTGAHR